MCYSGDMGFTSRVNFSPLLQADLFKCSEAKRSGKLDVILVSSHSVQETRTEHQDLPIFWGMGETRWPSQNHRITEWFGLEGTLELIWFPPPCHEQGHLPPDQVAQSSIQPGLEPCQGGGSHSFSGQPVSVPHHPHGEEFLPNI